MTEEISALPIRNESLITVKKEIIDPESININSLNDVWKETISVNTGDWMHVKEIKSDQVEHYYHDERIEPEEYNNAIMNSYDTTMRKAILKYDQIAEVTNLKDSACIHLGEKLITPDYKLEAIKNQNLLLHDQIPADSNYFQYSVDSFNIKQNATLKRIHTKDPLECTKCNFKSKDRSCLVNHERSHSNEKPFECTEYGFRTGQKRQLVGHNRTDTAEKKFECPECGFTTAYKDYLVVHIRTHAGRKPFECTECGFKTGRKGVFAKHKRSHTGENVFECAECSFVTAYKGNLARHKRTHIVKKR